MTDGYLRQEELVKKYNDMQNLIANQMEINKELLVVSTEMGSLPEMPESLDKWVDSLSDLDSKNFKLSDFKKMFKISKKYNDLVERREQNSQKIKALVIDNLIDQIKTLLNK